MAKIFEVATRNNTDWELSHVCQARERGATHVLIAVEQEIESLMNASKTDQNPGWSLVLLSDALIVRGEMEKVILEKGMSAKRI